MSKMIEISGRSHVFTLKDGSTFRIGARQSKDFDIAKKSDMIDLAIKKGLIYIKNEPVVTSNKTNKEVK